MKTQKTNFIKRFFQKAGHFWERIVRETKRYPQMKKVFGKKVARVTFKDGLCPPGKSPKYIETIQNYVDDFLSDVVEKHNALPDESWDYADYGIPSLTLCVPVGGELHGDAGVLLRKESATEYCNVLSLLAGRLC